MRIDKGEVCISAALNSNTVDPESFASLLNFFWKDTDDAFEIEDYCDKVTDRLDSAGAELIKTLAGYLGMDENDD